MNGTADGPGMITRARAAGVLVADRSELWVPGALAALAFLGWLPLVLALSPPNAGDVAFFATSLVTAANFPANVVVLAAFVAFGGVCASLLIASGETLLLRDLLALEGSPPADHTFDEALLRVWAAQLVAALPALLAAAALGLGLAAVGPGEYQSPDINGSILVRLARDLWPLEALLVIAVLGGQAYGAAAARRAARIEAGLAHALRSAARALVARPLPLIGVGLVTALVEAAWLVGSWSLLGRLWAPIGNDLAGGRLADPTTALLLVAFIAIWLCAVAIGGVLHAWSSAWWSLELAGVGNAARRSGIGEGAVPR